MAQQDLRGSLYVLNLDQQDSVDEPLARIEAIMAEIAEEAGIWSAETLFSTEDPRSQGTLVYDKFKHPGQ